MISDQSKEDLIPRLVNYIPKNSGNKLIFDDIIDIEYNLNQFNYRSPEFKKNPDLLFGGCSVTFGVGLPEEYTWWSLLSKKLGAEKIANISMYGNSIEKAVYSIIKYIKLYGSPKAICFLAPEPYRYEAFFNGVLGVHSLSRDDKYENKFSKYPYPPSEVISGDNALYSSIRALITLETICKAANIKLVWGTWSPHTEKLIETVGSFYFEYYLQGLENGHVHKKYLNKFMPEDKEKTVFNLAADRLNGSLGHFGSNYHRGIAEEFERGLLL